MNQTAHTPTAGAARMASAQVTARLGIRVMAGSPLSISKPAVSGQDWIITDDGATEPCRISLRASSSLSGAASLQVVPLGLES
jgi:hypothetical protein